MSSLRLLFAPAVLAWLATCGPAPADVVLSPLFSDHAVLQRSARVPVWGTASPGEKVAVTLDQAAASATADAAGKWRVDLDLHATGPGPFDLKVQARNHVTVSDVVVGQVWLASGQSNMAFPLGRSADGPAEVAASANPQLRFFDVPRSDLPAPADKLKGGRWVVAGPGTTSPITAVGYYFAKRLQNELKVPVGLIEANVGGTAVELWMSSQALARDNTLEKGAEKNLAANQLYARYHGTLYRDWLEKYGRNDHPAPDTAAWAAPDTDVKDWKSITLPADNLTSFGLPDAGAVWIRKTITLPPALAGIPLRLDIGPVHDFATVYWNGHPINDSNPKNGLPAPTGFGIAAPLAQAGKATVAIRIFAPFHGLNDAPRDVRDNMGSQGVPLTGTWLAKTEFALPPASPAATADYPAAVPSVPAPSSLFNGMIHPLIPYAIRGVIWYQGESNETRAFQYGTSFPLMITDWRQKWGEGDFPFYFCQLPNLGRKPAAPEDSNLAELREAQDKALKLPHTAEAVLVDVGEPGNLHPLDKKDPGERLARIALALDYGKKVSYAGPVFASMTVEGKTIRVHFKCAPGGLVALPLPASYRPLSDRPLTVPLVRNTPQSQLEGFAVCGADHKWAWATATIQGSDVLVQAASVPAPIAVRYGWAGDPIVNLSDASGLPAAPFRTDNLPVRTSNATY